ncbi:MAG: ATP-dependent Clp protease adaptor ClpS [Bacteroidetes bacterium]|nr:MAG: ATP-dependent Clp protease adaptor ClpS [Bacteroidota bacterium]
MQLKKHSTAVYNATHPLQEDEVDVLDATEEMCRLIVWNDEVNTFDWVIHTLMEVCGHTEEQAEQCALLIHTQGKYAVKNGSYDTLEPMCTAICDRQINATVE